MASKAGFKNLFNHKKFNIVIRIMILSDFFILSSFGLITPVFAIFITETISNGGLATVGIASGIYYITKSLFQIPLGIFIDKIKGEHDDFWALFLGSIFFSLVPLMYLLIDTPTQLYFVQFFYGFSAAICVPSWYAIFTRHIDKKLEGVEWGIYTTLADLGIASTATLSGILASNFGFSPLFIMVSLVSLMGSGFLWMIKAKMRKN